MNHWINIEQVIKLHDEIVKETGGSTGIRDLGVIDSALKAPLQTFGSQDLFPSIIEKITRLGYGLAANHGFIDGNKRIGAHAMLVLFELNNIHLQFSQSDLAEIFLKVADNKCNYEQLLEWVNKHLIK